MKFTSREWEFLRKCWHLTPREIEVAKLVCEGFDNENIGDRLHIRYNTVRAHLGNIFRKTAAPGKAKIILEFIEGIQRAKI